MRIANREKKERSQDLMLYYLTTREWIEDDEMLLNLAEHNCTIAVINLLAGELDPEKSVGKKFLTVSSIARRLKVSRVNVYHSLRMLSTYVQQHNRYMWLTDDCLHDYNSLQEHLAGERFIQEVKK